MSDRSAIEWTDATWNPIRCWTTNHLGFVHPGWYCEHVSPGCEYCYAEVLNHRFGTGLPFKPGHRKHVQVFLDEKTLLAPLRWKKPRMIFVCSMSDLFGSWVEDKWIDHIFDVMARCPQHTFQVLTKRPERMRDIVAKPWLPNVWLGVSAEDQQRADERIHLLLDTPAAVRFVSLEPLLGPIDLTNLQGVAFDALYGVNERTLKIDWVIAGGESGHGARPVRIEWVRSLRDQCQAAGVPYFFKQWGEHRPDDPTANRTSMVRVGKKAAGRLLDGVEHNGMPL